MTQTAHAKPLRRGIGTLPELSAYLGVHIDTIRGWRRAGTIPGAVRLGVRWGINAKKFDEKKGTNFADWLREQPAQPNTRH